MDYARPILIVMLWGYTSAQGRAQSPEDKQHAAIAKMQAAVARQRQSVARQVRLESPPGGSFFTVPWLGPPVVESVGGGVPDCPPLAAAEVDKIVEEAALKEAVKPDLLRAVMAQESGFRPCAVSPKGALGLMQLMPATVAQLGVQDPFDPRENVASGARLLKELLARYGGDTAAALAAYNAGPARVDSSGGVPAIPETIQYVKAILSALGH